MLVNPSLYKEAGWDTMKNFKCVGLAVWNQSVAVVNPAMPAKTLADFVELAKSKPGQLNFGNAGTGASTDLAAQRLFQAANIKLTNVGYKGQPPALIDLMSNLMNFEVVSLSLALPHIKAGTIKPLAVFTEKRVRGASRRADHHGGRISAGRLYSLVRHLCAGGDARCAGRENS